MIIKSLSYRKFKIWQTYKNSKPEIIFSNYAIHAAESFCEKHSLSKNSTVFYIREYDNNTKQFHNQEIGTLYVTEIN